MKKYEKTDVDVPGALELTVPEQVNVVAAAGRVSDLS